jgi:multicomponent Na+:H+ antiporter subunit D
MTTENNVLLLLPVIAPLVAGAIALLFTGNNRLQRYLGVLGAGTGWIASLGVLYLNWEEGIQVYRLGGWETPFGILLTVDKLSALFGVMANTVVAGGLLYAVGCKDKSVSKPTFTTFFLGMGAGLSLCLYTGDLFNFFVGLELMVICSIILVAISDNKLGLEAAIKYLFISSMGTVFLLIGIAALYATFGTLTLADLAIQLRDGSRPFLAREAAVLLMSAFLLKSAVFPFHFWQPDFHTTAPTPVHSVLSSVVVKVGIYGLIRLTTLLFIDEAQTIQDLLIVLGIIGIFFGSLGAYKTYDAKRLLAYSTFGQIGFILVAIGWGTPLALAAAIIYAVNHSFIKSSLLMLTGVISSRLESKSAAIAQIGGAGKGMVLTSGLYLTGGLALAGIPPTNGFISKVALVQGGIGANGWLSLGLAIGAGIITLMYMIKTWQLIFQQPAEQKHKYKPYHDSPLAPTLLIALCVILGVYAVPLVDAANDTVEQIYDPDHYISAVFPEREAEPAPHRSLPFGG